jgi:hypothetical protein
VNRIVITVMVQEGSNQAEQSFEMSGLLYAAAQSAAHTRYVLKTEMFHLLDNAMASMGYPMSAPTRGE